MTSVLWLSQTEGYLNGAKDFGRSDGTIAHAQCGRGGRRNKESILPPLRQRYASNATQRTFECGRVNPPAQRRSPEVVAHRTPGFGHWNWACLDIIPWACWQAR